MKIQPRDIGLLAIGFVLGSMITISLSLSPSPSPTPQVSGVVLTGSTFLASLPSPPFASNMQFQLPPARFEIRHSFGSPSPQYPPVRMQVDLIDTHYQPDIRPEDLK